MKELAIVIAYAPAMLLLAVFIVFNMAPECRLSRYTLRTGEDRLAIFWLLMQIAACAAAYCISKTWE